MIVGHIGGGSVGGYQVQRSVRLRAGNAANFSRTPGSAGNKKTLTYSLFVKLGSLSSTRDLLTCGSAASNFFYFAVNSSDQLVLQCITGSTEVARFTAPANRRDPNAWYHIVLSIDMAQASGANGMRLWVNGEQQTITVTTYIQNSSLYINEASQAHYIGRASLSAGEYFDGYLSEVNFIDGQALTPTSFAEQDTTTRMWVPKKYVGTYGTNGFYLDFSDITSTTTLGYDKSGNGNNWTANNISLTSGITYDSMLDVPGLPWADGGNGRGNYCTLNPMSLTQHGSRADMKWGNLFADGSPYTSAGNMNNSLTQQVTQPVYIEVTTDSSWSLSGQAAGFGFIPAGVSIPAGQSPGQVTNGAAFVFGAGAAWGKRQNGGSFTSISLSNSVAGTVMMVAYNPLTGNAWVGKDGAWNGSGNPSTGANPDLTGIPASVIEPVVNTYRDTGGNNCQLHVNCGQRPFAYTPPTGFKALNTANLPDPTGAAAKPWEHFDAKLWVGNGSTQNITGLAFQPDMVWPKARSAIRDNRVVDSVRGVTKSLQPNLIDAELTEVNGLTAFLSNGFSLGSQNGFNALNETHVGWCWKAGGTAVTNNSGTISSQVSANTAAGFSIVTYTGTGAAATVGHGLGVAPKLIIVKDRTVTGSAAPFWFVYHANQNASPATGYLALEQTAAFSSNAAVWNNTAPTSSVFSIGAASQGTNFNGHNFGAYCFAEIPGFSKFGSYTGNGSADGPFVFCGFRPKYVLLKCSSNAGLYWFIFDSARNTYNVLDAKLGANASDAETTGQTNLDFTANGFKVRTDQTSTNGSGYTYIYAAFAESPFKFANAR